MRKFISQVITLVVLSLFAMSCGKAPSNVLSGVKVETQTVNDDLWMSFAADLNLGAMSFASISLPIIHPRGQTPIGQLELINGLNGANQIKVSVNVSEIADVQTARAALPNGNMIPLIANNEVIAIRIGKGAFVYLAISQTVTAIGVAVPISAFDNIGQKLPGLNFFPVVTSGDVIGTAGIFTGLNAGQNGIAVVADVTKVVNLGQLLPQAPMALIAADNGDEVKLNYQSQSAPAQQKAKLDQMIFDLNKKRSVLRMR